LEPPARLAATFNANCFDVELNCGLLAASSYTIVISAFENISLAENVGTGTLTDGFSGLGNLNGAENLNYAFDLNLSPTIASTPEPTAGIMLLTGIALIAARFPHRRRT